MRFAALPAAMLLLACGDESSTTTPEQIDPTNLSSGVLNAAVQYCTGGEEAPIQPTGLMAIADKTLPELVQRFIATEDIYDATTARIAKFEQNGAEVWVLRESASPFCEVMLTNADNHSVLLEELLTEAVLAPDIDDPTFQQPFWALPLSVEAHDGSLAYAKLEGAGIETAKKDEIQLTISVGRPEKVM